VPPALGVDLKATVCTSSVGMALESSCLYQEQRSVEHDPVSGSRSNRILHFRTGLEWILKNLNRIRYGYPNCIDHCSKMLNQRVFSEYELDWIKYFDRST